MKLTERYREPLEVNFKKAAATLGITAAALSGVAGCSTEKESEEWSLVAGVSCSTEGEVPYVSGLWNSAAENSVAGRKYPSSVEVACATGEVMVQGSGVRAENLNKERELEERFRESSDASLTIVVTDCENPAASSWMGIKPGPEAPENQAVASFNGTCEITAVDITPNK